VFTVVNLWVPFNVGNFLSGCRVLEDDSAPVSVRRTSHLSSELLENVMADARRRKTADQ
jgi:hypothetical protein